MRLRWELFAIPAAFFFVIVFAIPLVFFISSSFHQDLGYGRVSENFTLGNYAKVVSDPFFLRVIKVSLSLSLQTVLFSLVLAFPVARFFVRSQSRWKSVLVPLFFISSFITVVIRALGWIIVLRSNGPINQALIGLNLLHEPIRFLGSEIGVVIGLVHFVLPLAVLALISVLQTIPGSLEEAARTLGARPFRVFTRVVFPISLPGVIAVSLMIFSMTISIFTSIMLLGGGRVMALPVLIQQEIVRKVNYAMGSTLSMLLLISVLVVNAGFALVAARTRTMRSRRTA